jgi:hypothetical protein
MHAKNELILCLILIRAPRDDYLIVGNPYLIALRQR